MAGRFFQHAASVSVSRPLGRRLSGYGEVYVVSPDVRHGSSAWMADAGVARVVGRHLQVDVELGHALTPCGPDWFAGFGIVARMPIRLFRLH
jgi:hypothetical protein